MPGEIMDKFWDREIAVILNANARKVSNRIVDSVKKFVPEAQLYVSKTMEEGQEYVREIVKRNYSHLVLGGGDGTLVEIINQLRKSLRDLGHGDAAMPKLGFLKLGTGNGWAGMLGVDNGKRTLPKIANPDDWRLTRFNLLESDDRLFHFAGMGWDASILNDFFLFRQKFGRGPLKRFFGGLQGYLASMIFKTIPEQLMERDRTRIRVINQDPEVFECKLDQPPRPLNIGVGETLYEGPANVFGGSTTPYYGFNLTAFPFARAKEGFMNFRVVSAGVIDLMMHCRKIFAGTYQPSTFKDFLAKRVTIEVDKPRPFQIGGDPCGLRDRLDLAVSDLSVQVLDLTPA
jgi:diacylglycerol kinase family enzyme